MHVLIFEGGRWTSFAPLSITRPVFSLVCGMTTLLEKQVELLKPTRLTLWVRPQLVAWCRANIVPKFQIPVAINEPLDDEFVLISSGRSLHLSQYEWPTEPCICTDSGGDLIRKAYVRAPGLSPDDCMNRSQRWLDLQSLPHTMPQDRLPAFLWDLLSWNEEALVADAIRLRSAEHAPAPQGPWHVISGDDVYLAEGVKLSPGVVLDASKGSIVLDTGASVGPNSVIVGPCYVGPYTSVSPLTVIRPGTTIGPGCKVGGEISNAIMLGNSNKAHEGFLGDSYLGEWINIGAGTNTSNLKNTYGPVKVRVGPKTYASDRRFLGSLVGDHTKTSISTRLMGGSYVGAFSLLAGSAIAPNFTPSFSFWTDRGMERYRMEKVREVIEQVFARRNRPFTDADLGMIHDAADAAAMVENPDEERASVRSSVEI